LGGAEELDGSEGAEAVEEIAGDEVGARFAAGEGEHRHVGTAAAGEPGNGGAVFIVRVGGNVKDAGGGLELEKRAPEAGGAAVFGKRVGRK
jgi:hypothetical protein